MERRLVLAREGKLASLLPGVAGEGAVFAFPPDGDGRVVYCNVEGVSWLSPDTVVVVSDRARRDGQDVRCRAKDQSIHVFVIPG